MSETSQVGLLGTLIERLQRYAPCVTHYFDGRPDGPGMVPVAGAEFVLVADVEAALATLPQHLKDCAVWLGSSSNPESDPLPCDCGASLSRLQEIAAAREIIGGCVTSLDVMNHGSKSANAVDLVWASVPWLIAEVKRLAASPPAQAQEHFQVRVRRWLLACFGQDIANDITERNHRFLEEALELVQTSGCTRSEAHQLVDYVFDRPVGEMEQELGGTMVTLAALCSAAGIDMELAAERELTRVWTAIDKIKAKQATKPKHSPLPAAAPPAQGWPQPEDIIEACANYLNKNYGDEAAEFVAALQQQGWGPILPAPPLAAQEPYTEKS